jgi:hypothetical protein
VGTFETSTDVIQVAEVPGTVMVYTNIFNNSYYGSRIQSCKRYWSSNVGSPEASFVRSPIPGSSSQQRSVGWGATASSAKSGKNDEPASNASGVSASVVVGGSLAGVAVVVVVIIVIQKKRLFCWKESLSFEEKDVANSAILQEV